MLPLKRILLLFFFLLATCYDLRAQEIVHQDANTFAKEIANGTSVQLIDVRTAPEYAEGHLADATLIDWKDQKKFQSAIKKLDKNKAIYLYCRSGRRSTDAGNYLIKQGFKQVFNLEGGIQAWQASSKTVEK